MALILVLHTGLTLHIVSTTRDHHIVMTLDRTPNRRLSNSASMKQAGTRPVHFTILLHGTSEDLTSPADPVRRLTFNNVVLERPDSVIH